MLSQLLSFFTPQQIKLSFFGSSITFTNKGDVIIKAKRFLITEYDYALHKCPSHIKEEIERLQQSTDSETSIQTYLDKINAPLFSSRSKVPQ